MKLTKPLFCLSLLTAPLVQAEIYVTPRLAVESQQYTTKFLDNTITVPTLGLSLFSTSGVFFDVEWLDFDEYENGAQNHVDGESSITHRDELTLTSGYRFDSGIIAFGGYKTAQTEGLDGDADRWLFDTSGPFVGLSGSMKVTNRLQLGLSAAVASMKGSVEVTETNSASNFEGDSFGFSTSASLNMSIYKGLIGSLGVKFQAYDYGDQIATEEIQSLFAKIAYRF